MAKISVSIPDELKEQLDSYADQTGLKRSKAVAHILEEFFSDQARLPASLDSKRLDEFDEDLDEVQAYLAQLHEQDPEHFPRPPWVEKPVLRSRSYLFRSRRS